MNDRDGWFVGLLALAFLYLDADMDTRTMNDDAYASSSSPADDDSADRARLLPVPMGRALPVKVVARDECPRNPLHTVALRADGAMWCRGCDEAFYPQVFIWDAIMNAAAA